MTEEKTKFGACTISKNLYTRASDLKYCIREAPKTDLDSGWIFLTNIDTEEYLNNPENWVIVSFETVIEIEPAVLSIFNLPVGTDITLENKDGKRFFINTKSEKKLSLPD